MINRGMLKKCTSSVADTDPVGPAFLGPPDLDPCESIFLVIEYFLKYSLAKAIFFL